MGGLKGSMQQRRWAAPLKDMLPRLLAKELDRNQRHYRFAPISSGAVATPKARLAIDVTRFDVSRFAGATVSAHWVYRSSAPNSLPVEGNATASAAVSSGGYDELVDALRLVALPQPTCCSFRPEAVLQPKTLPTKKGRTNPSLTVPKTLLNETI
jgi:uncharacterized lipoprotein YmbA